MTSNHQPMRAVFMHLDLGLGGAERLIVDAACALKLRKNEILIATSHHDPNRCFEETMPALGGLIARDIRCVGDWIPRHAMGGRFHVLFACLRMACVAWRFAKASQPDVVIIDQVSYIVPLVKLLNPTVPVLFYCHFPDKLLAPPSKSLPRRLYRAGFDYLEELSTACADGIVVNSRFTARVVSEAFPAMSKSHPQFEVLYPSIDVGLYEAVSTKTTPLSSLFAAQARLREVVLDGRFVLSINRFERKKGLDLAIRALKECVNRDFVLVMTGGYDVRVQENVEHLTELKNLARNLGLEDRVLFLPSCTQDEKLVLLENCRVLVYTPENEHFGIVPIEAGASSKPCIACNSGGPLESLVDQVTGLLVNPSPEAFAEAIDFFLDERDGEARSKTFGAAAKKRIETLFAREAFGEKLESILRELIENKKIQNDPYDLPYTTALNAIAMALIAAMVIGYFMIMHAFAVRTNG